MDATLIVDTLLGHDDLYKSLRRCSGQSLQIAYMLPGRGFALRGSDRFPSPTDRTHEVLDFPAVRFFVEDVMDIELLWKPWTLAVTPAGLGNPCCYQLDDKSGYVLRAFVYAPFVSGASAFWDQLRTQLQDSRGPRY